MLSKYMVFSAYHLALAYGLPGRLDASHKRILCYYVCHASDHLGVKILWAKALESTLHMIVIVPPEISLDEFVERVQEWTLSWMQMHDPFCDFGGWKGNYYIMSLTPEDCPRAVELLKSLHRDLTEDAMISQLGLLERYGCDRPCYHHIIFGITRCLMRLNLKFSQILKDEIYDLGQRIYCPIVVVEVMREHIHMLASLPTDISVLNFTMIFREETQKWMSTNIHFRSVPQWSEAFSAFTITPSRIENEVELIQRQPFFHRKGNNYRSEIFHLSRRLGIFKPNIESLPYF